MWIIEWSVKGFEVWQFWGGPYDEEMASSILIMLGNPRFDYRICESNGT